MPQSLLARTAGKLNNALHGKIIKNALGPDQAGIMRSGSALLIMGANAHLEQHKKIAMFLSSDGKGCFPNTDIFETFKLVCKHTPECVGYYISVYGETQIACFEEFNHETQQLERVWYYVKNGLIQGEVSAAALATLLCKDVRDTNNDVPGLTHKNYIDDEGMWGVVVKEDGTTNFDIVDALSRQNEGLKRFGGHLDPDKTYMYVPTMPKHVMAIKERIDISPRFVNQLKQQPAYAAHTQCIWKPPASKRKKKGKKTSPGPRPRVM